MNKDLLRKEYAAKRRVLSDEEVAQKSALLVDSFFSSFQFDPKVTIHIFLTIPHKKEIHTDLFIERFTSLYPDGRIVVPKIIPEKRGEMSCLLWKRGMQMNINALGISEPVEEIAVSENEINVVLVPLLISDYQGNRVGYGKGYYDQFLKRCRPDVVKCGLSLFEPVKDIIKVDSWDVPLDYCISPSGLHKSIKN